MPFWKLLLVALALGLAVGNALLDRQRQQQQTQLRQLKERIEKAEAEHREKRERLRQLREQLERFRPTHPAPGPDWIPPDRPTAV